MYKDVLYEAHPKPSLLKILSDMRNLIKVPFFIAGGSVFSSIYDVEYQDIDVWFYNKDDYETASNILLNLCQKRKKEESKRQEDEKPDAFGAISLYTSYHHHKTKNSLTLTGFFENHAIQLICKNFGTPEDILFGFDLYNSMCCITSDGDFFQHPNCSQTLKINYNVINFQTLQRTFKYIEAKKCVDVDQIEMKKLITYIVENAFETMLDGYSETKFQAIVSIVRQQFRGKYKDFFFLIHDKIRSIYNDEDRIKLFRRLMGNITFKKVPLNNPLCTEYYLAHYLFLRKRTKEIKLEDTDIFPNFAWKQLSDKYPEYLI